MKLYDEVAQRRIQQLEAERDALLDALAEADLDAAEKDTLIATLYAEIQRARADRSYLPEAS